MDVDVVAKARTHFVDADDQDDQEDEQARPHALSVQLYIVAFPLRLCVGTTELVLVKCKDCDELAAESVVDAAPMPCAIKSPIAGEGVVRDWAAVREAAHSGRQHCVRILIGASTKRRTYGTANQRNAEAFHTRSRVRVLYFVYVLSMYECVILKERNHGCIIRTSRGS